MGNVNPLDAFIGLVPGKRPVIIYLQDFNEKKVIQDNAKTLKGSRIYIQSDYSQSTLEKRKQLWESAKSDKNQGKKVHLVHDKLKIDKEVYVWNETENKRVKVIETDASHDVIARCSHDVIARRNHAVIAMTSPP